MPTKKCEICGDEVQNLAFKKHMATHSESKTENKESEGNNVETKKDKQKAKSEKKVNPEVASLLEQAIQNEEKMLDAPDMFFGEDATDQHSTLARVHCPECLGDDAEFKVVYGSAKKNIEGYAAKAYRPVFNDKGEHVKDEDGNPMFKVRKDIFYGRKKRYQEESARKLRNVTQEAKKKTPSAGVSEEEFNIEKK